MPAKKGSKYLNAKTSSILSQYNPEDIQKFLNSGEFKSDIAKKLGIHIKAFNSYIRKHNLTYKTPRHTGGIQPNAKNKLYRPAIIKHNSRNQGNFCPELVTL